jgi:hypothetical protein
MMAKVLRTATAWEIGGEDWTPTTATERVRVKGGRALYDAAWANGASLGKRPVRLSRIDSRRPGATIRWVEAERMLEIVETEG